MWLRHKFKGTDKAIEMWEKAVKYPILVKGDPDVDGILSYLEVIKALRRLNLKWERYINPNRLHGMQEGESYKGKFFINVDSGISWDELRGLVDNGNYVLSIDHHEVEWEEDEPMIYTNGEFTGIILNNSYNFEPDAFRFLSGCGIVVNFFNWLLGSVDIESTVATGITLLSDVRNIENDLARGILETTFKTHLAECKNISFLSKICEFSYSQAFRRTPEYLDRSYIDYRFSPYFNASLQFNLGEYILDLAEGKFISFIDSKKYRKEVLEVIEKQIEERDLENLKILMLDLGKLGKPNFKGLYVDYTITNFIGLVANRYLEQGKSVLIVGLDGNSFVRGSFRGINIHADYLSVLENIGFDVRGHKGAFGVRGILKPIDFGLLNKNIGLEEEKYKDVDSQNIVSYGKMLDNLAEIESIAYENQFLLSQNFKKIYYSGLSYEMAHRTSGTVTWIVDGLSVKSFDVNLDFKDGLIEPVYSEGKLELYLKEVL